MDDVSRAKAALKFAKRGPASVDLWQQALQAGRLARTDEAAQREAPVRQPLRHERQQ
jgi:hypothetical protein